MVTVLRASLSKNDSLTFSFTVALSQTSGGCLENIADNPSVAAPHVLTPHLLTITTRR